MKKFMLIMLVALAAACSSTKHSTSSTGSTTPTTATTSTTEEGSSFENAVVIEEKSERTGISAEYKWVDKHYPGYKRKMQSLQTHDKKPYDVLTIVTAEGTEKKIYFDISNFFGKF